MSLKVQNFTPNSAYTVSASTSSANQALSQPTNAAGPPYPGYSDIVVYNSTAGVAFLSVGNSAQTATTNSPFQVAPGAVTIFDMGSPYTNIGVILSSGSGNVYIMLGGGSQ